MAKLFNEQEEGDLTTSIKRSIELELIDLHTAQPGIIESSDGTTATVSLPVYRNGVNGPVKIPNLEGVPVVFQRTQTHMMTMPLAGTPCLVHFCERSIDQWMHEGIEGVPTIPRRHDFSDAVCVPGLNSATITEFDSDFAQFRSTDGTANYSISSSGKLKVESSGEELFSLLSEVLNVLSQTNAIVASGSSAGTWSIDTQAQFAALQSRLDTMRP